MLTGSTQRSDPLLSGTRANFGEALRVCSAESYAAQPRQIACRLRASGRHQSLPKDRLDGT